MSGQRQDLQQLSYLAEELPQFPTTCTVFVCNDDDLFWSSCWQLCNSNVITWMNIINIWLTDSYNKCMRWEGSHEQSWDTTNPQHTRKHQAAFPKERFWSRWVESRFFSSWIDSAHVVTSLICSVSSHWSSLFLYNQRSSKPLLPRTREHHRNIIFMCSKWFHSAKYTHAIHHNMCTFDMSQW